MANLVTNKEVNKYIKIWTGFYNKVFNIKERDQLTDDENFDVTLYEFGLSSKKTKNYKRAMRKLNGVKYSNKNRLPALNLFKSVYALHQKHDKPGFFNFTARYARYKEGKFVKNLEKNLLKKGCPKEYLEAIKNDLNLSVGELIFKVDNTLNAAKNKAAAKEEVKLEKTEELKKAVEINENEMVKDNTAVKNSDLTYEELHGSAEKLFKAVVSDHGNEEIITTTTEKEFDVDDDVKSIDESYIRKNAPVDIEEEEKEFNPIITEAYIKSTMEEEPDLDSMQHQNEIIENETKDLLDI